MYSVKKKPMRARKAGYIHAGNATRMFNKSIRKRTITKADTLRSY